MPAYTYMYQRVGTGANVNYKETTMFLQRLHTG